MIYLIWIRRPQYLYFNTNVDVEYVYPGNGDYTISLKVSSEICEDVYEYDIRVRSSKPFELGPDKTYCGDFSHILDTDAPDALEVKWSTGSTNYQTFVNDVGIYDVLVSYGKNCIYRDKLFNRYKK